MGSAHRGSRFVAVYRATSINLSANFMGDLVVPEKPLTFPDELHELVERVRVCTLCELSSGRTNAVPGEGKATSGLMFIGEAPGFNEDRQGRPFVGRSGKLLEKLIAKIPQRREHVYITNVIKCRPPENRDPLPHEVESCWPYLEKQIDLINPRVIVTLGRHALMRFFPEARISRDHGKLLRWRNRIVFPIYHPAAALRSSQFKKALEDDMVKIPEGILASLDDQTTAISVDTDTRESSRITGPSASSGSDNQLNLF